jgi:hypothetical protein
MSSCWKCGKDLEGISTECENDCKPVESKKKKKKDEVSYELDMNKVKTLEDVILILKCLEIRVTKELKHFNLLKKFFKKKYED